MRNYWMSLTVSGRGRPSASLVSFLVASTILLVLSVLTSYCRGAEEDIVQEMLAEAKSAASQQADVPQQDAAAQEIVLEEKADELTHEYKMTQARYKLYECILLAVFALVSLLIIMKALCNKPNCSAAYMVNASGLVFIIFGTLILVLLADVDEQLNAGVGIIGAVAGYLFGTMRRMEPETRPPAETKPPADKS